MPSVIRKPEVSVDALGWFRPGDLPSPLHSQLPVTLAMIGLNLD
jgi:hypothetical protein